MKRRIPTLVVLLLCLVPITVTGQPLIPGGLTDLQPPYGEGAFPVVNPDFEGGLTGWTHDSAYSIDTTVFHGGAASLKMTGAPNIPYTNASYQPLKLPAGTYRLSAWIKTENVGANADGTGVRLRLNAGGPQCYGCGASTVVIRGTTEWTEYVIDNIDVGADAANAMLLFENYGDPDGAAWVDDIRLVRYLPAPITAFMIYPNYRGYLFEDQPMQVRLEITVGLESFPGPLADYEVRATLAPEAGGAPLATATAPVQNGELTLDASAIAPGTAYLVTATVVKKSDGNAFFAYPAYRVSRVTTTQKAAMKIAVDDKGFMIVRGVRRFMLGVFDAGTPESPSVDFFESTLFDPGGMRRMLPLRANFYINYQNGNMGEDSLRALTSTLANHGYIYAQTANCFESYRAPAGSGFNVDDSDAYVTAYAQMQGGGGYYVADECRNEMVPGTFEQYQRIKRLDPDSFTLASNLASTTSLRLWPDSVDVLATDPYPLYGPEPAEGYNTSKVYLWARQLRAAAREIHPWWMDLQFFQATGDSRWPTRAELRNQALMSIVEGARGLFWWSLGVRALAWVCPEGSATWCDERVAHMDDLTAVVNELADLEAVLLADDTPTAATTATPGIATKVKTVNGKGYVFAYNETGAPQTATFTWAAPVAVVNVHGENRSLPASGASFTDTFSPYEAHIYVVDEAPHLTAITPSGVLTTTQPTYTWTPIGPGAWYQLAVEDSTGLKIQQWYSSAEAGCEAGTGTCAITPAVPLASGPGRWWVFTWVGYGVWSSAQTFTVPQIVPPLTAITPSGVLTTTQPTYTWTPIGPEAWYQLAVEDSTGLKIQQWYSSAEAGCEAGTGTCAITPAVPLASGPGRWWVFTWVGYGLWSYPQPFAVE